MNNKYLPRHIYSNANGIFQNVVKISDKNIRPSNAEVRTYEGDRYLFWKYKNVIPTESRDYWFRIESFLQQNWALIQSMPEDKFIVFFLSEDSGVFYEIEFSSLEEATEALTRNGFRRHNEVDKKYIPRPEPPFFICPHRNGQIYSSGRYRA